MTERTTCARRIDTNNGHDFIDVTATKYFSAPFSYSEERVEIVFSGRDSTSVTVRLTDVRDVAEFGKALLDAADSLDRK